MVHTKVADQVCAHGIRCPLSINDIIVRPDVEAVELGALAKLVKAAFGLVYGIDPLVGL